MEAEFFFDFSKTGILFKASGGSLARGVKLNLKFPEGCSGPELRISTFSYNTPTELGCKLKCSPISL